MAGLASAATLMSANVEDLSTCVRQVYFALDLGDGRFRIDNIAVLIKGCCSHFDNLWMIEFLAARARGGAISTAAVSIFGALCATGKEIDIITLEVSIAAFKDRAE